MKLVLPALLGGLDTKQWRAKQARLHSCFAAIPTHCDHCLTPDP